MNDFTQISRAISWAAPEGPLASGAGMANRTNTSAPYYSYEYYLDYLDLMPVDEKKLSANKREF